MAEQQGLTRSHFYKRILITLTEHIDAQIRKDARQSTAEEAEAALLKILFCPACRLELKYELSRPEILYCRCGDFELMGIHPDGTAIFKFCLLETRQEESRSDENN